MSRTPVLRTAAVATALACGLLALPTTASAVTATKAELRGTQLRVEGTSRPGAFVQIESTTSATGTRADTGGRFTAQATGFTAPDCRLTITDSGTPTATVTITGCTPSAIPVPPTPAPPTGSCVITPVPPAALPAGTMTVVNFSTTGCDTTTGSGPTPTPVQWSIAAGAIPTGMVGPHFQGTTAGNIIGTPSVPGTYRFTLQVRDQIGATDQETVTVTVT